MIATFALLGTGFYLTYRKPKKPLPSGPDCACPAPRTNRTGRVMLWIATGLVAMFLAFPYIAQTLWG
jgi:hypothetical protein